MVLLEGYKPYCSRCGWNNEIVLSELLLTIKATLLLFAIGLIFVIVAVLRNVAKAPEVIVLILTFTVLPGGYGLFAFFKKRRLEGLSFEPVYETPSFIISERSSAGAPRKSVTFNEKEFPELAALPRPRKIRMTWKGRFYRYRPPSKN